MVSDPQHQPMTLVFNTVSLLPFTLNLGSQQGTLMGLFRFCTSAGLGVWREHQRQQQPQQTSSSARAHFATTQMNLLDSRGNLLRLPQTAVSGNLTFMADDYSCFALHASFSNLTGSLTIASIEMTISTADMENCTQPLANCIVQREYFPVPLQNSLQLFVDKAGFIEPAAALAASESLVTIDDTIPPSFSNCPGSQTAIAHAGLDTVSVSWTVPDVHDNVAVASVDKEVIDFGGTVIAHEFDARIPLHTWTYTAVDTSGLHAVCT